MMTIQPPISQLVWRMKYCHTPLNGDASERDVDETWNRVATALTVKESDREGWARRFYNVMMDGTLLPGGRILAGAGTGLQRTLFNTFMMGPIADDLDAVFTAIRESAATMRQGGGIGCNFSTLRPKGDLVHGTGGETVGPVALMELWDSMCRTLLNGGTRRGAMMATLACNHPDIGTFIEAKQQSAHLQHFNLSVLVTDAFMQAIRNDELWSLTFGGRVYSTVHARVLWDRILRATYEFSEPGVLFIDTINKRNNLSYMEEIIGTNSCGEVPLPAYGGSPIATLNLARLIQNPFTADAHLDWARFHTVVTAGVRMLDNAIDESVFALPAQAAEARAKRRIGLGVTGLADALIACGVRYGTPHAIELTSTWIRALRDSSYEASCALATERGSFPAFDPKRFMAGPNVCALDPSLRKLMERHGLRNAQLNVIPPAGTVSLLAKNVSSGIEPIFSYKALRRVTLPDGSKENIIVEDYAVGQFRRQFGEDVTLPNYFVTSQELTADEHVNMQAAVQRYLDGSVSKTINCAENIAFEDLKSVYEKAYTTGCKGCTTYRPSAVRGYVLQTA